jgi:hypothetical protein
MRKAKYFIFILVFLGSLFFLFGPEVVPENYQFQNTLNLTTQKDVIIIFNSGGWGDTPLEKAEDFSPIIEGIEKTLKDWGYNSLVIPYVRTKDDFLGRIAGARDFLSSFKSSSRILAEKVEFLAEQFPDKKIIMAGLSSGAALVDETIEEISENSQIYAIEVGTPFWTETFESENILQLNNDGKDSLAAGEIKTLILSLIKAPFKWIFSKINGQNLTLSQSFHALGHEYSWSSPEVGPQIVTFLENKFR